MKIVRQMLGAVLVLCAVFQSCTARLYNPFLSDFAGPGTHLEKTHPFGSPGLTPRDLPPVQTNGIDLLISPLEMGPVSPHYPDPFPFTLPQPSDTRVHFNNIQPHLAGPHPNPFLPSDVTPFGNPPFDLVHPEGLGRPFVPPQPIDVDYQFGAPQSVDYYPPINPFQGDYVGPHPTYSSHVSLPFSEYETAPSNHPTDFYEPSYNLRFDREAPFFHPENDLYGFNEGNGYNGYNGVNGFDNGPWESAPPMSPLFQLGPFNSFQAPSPLGSPFPSPAFQNDHYSDIAVPAFESNSDVNPWTGEPKLLHFSPVNPSVPYPLAMQPVMDHMYPQPIHSFPPMMSQVKPMQPPHPMMNFVQPQMTPIFHPIMNNPDHLPMHPFTPHQPPVHPLPPVVSHPHPQSMQPMLPAPVHHPEPLHTVPFHPFYPEMNHIEPPIFVPSH